MLGKLINKLVDNTTAIVNNFTNRSFLEATIAASVLVASADGVIDVKEKAKIMAAIRNCDALKNYKTEDVTELFVAYSQKMDVDFDFGKIELLNIISKASREEKIAVYAIASMIANASGGVDENESNVLKELKQHIGIA